MEARDRHLGSIATLIPNTETVTVDVGALVRRLILFDECIIESSGLKEIPALVQTFGLKGTRLLLESGAIRFIYDLLTATNIGQLAISNHTQSRGYVLPPGSFRLASIGLLTEGPERKRFVSRALQEVNKCPIPLKEVIKLKSQIVGMLELYPPTAANEGVATTTSEVLRHDSWIWSVIRRVFASETGTDLGSRPRFEASDLGQDGDVRVDIPMTDDEKLPQNTYHELLQRSLLAASAINQRIHLMEQLGCVTGFLEGEIPFFQDKLRCLLKTIDPAVQETRFDRITTITGLPILGDLAPGVQIDARKLLMLREDPDCLSFRAWLRSVDQATDQDISDQFRDMHSKVSAVVEGKIGHALRFIITSGAGFVPVAGFALGPALSAVDAFLLEKIIGEPGPVTFLSRHYPSIFRNY